MATPVDRPAPWRRSGCRRQAGKPAADGDEQTEDLDEDHGAERRSIRSASARRDLAAVARRHDRAAGIGANYARAVMASTRRFAAARLVLVVFVNLGSLVVPGCGVFGAGTSATTQPPSPAERLIPVEAAAVTEAEAAVAVNSHCPGTACPTLGAGHSSSPARPTRSSGSSRIWEVGTVQPDYQALTTLAYWAVGLGPKVIDRPDR